MKDAYSFDIDADGLDFSYKKHYETYCKIFDRCGLKYVVVEAHSGAMGGSQSHEFMVKTSAGEDLVATCNKCNYAANLEKAVSKLDHVDDLASEGDGKPLEVHTPGQKTIEDVAKFLGVSPKNKIKTLALMAEETVKGETKPKLRPIIVFVRGDHQMNEAKLGSLIGGIEVRPMTAEEIEPLFHSPAGYLGPIGLTNIAHAIENKNGKFSEGTLLFVDKALEGRKNLIAGANKEDYHVKNIVPGRDFEPTVYADLRNVEAGDTCPNCEGILSIDHAVEIGHIFKLGYKYSDSMGARVLDRNGKEVAPIMGSYGIGIERILTAAVEQSNDENGFWLPPKIAPFEIVVTPTNVSDAKLLEVAVDLTQKLEAAGFDVLLDDRDERPGVKFKDADLVGIPFRINVGKKVTEDRVEVVQRSTRTSTDVMIAEAVKHFQSLLRVAQ
jgi:prolyl-tRNA synthetase